MEDISIKERYIEVFNRIDDLLKLYDGIITVAIDGMSGSGKSYLADLIADTYECNLFHMDDYFLPLDMRTEKRLNEPGGNIHYERFREEVLDPLRENRPVTSRAYSCGIWEYSEPRIIEPKRLNIIEGSYSMHPHLRDAYDLSIFLMVDREEQIRRIILRDPERSVQPFIDMWIPLENIYFNKLKIMNISDIIIDTSHYNP